MLASILLRLVLVPSGIGLLGLLGFVVYRLFFHPYAKYPGPFLAKLTNLYSAYHAWRGDLHLDMWRCHEKYGNYVRYGPNELLVNTESGLKDIYSHGKKFKKSVKYSAMVHRATNTLTETDRKKHGKKRRLISQAFSDSTLKSYEDAVLTHVQQLCDELVSNEGKPVPKDEWAPAKNISRWCDYFTFDVMTSVIFGVEWSALREEKYRYVPDSIEQSNVRIGTLLEAPGMKGWKILDKYLFGAAIIARNQFIKFINEILREAMRVTGKTKKGAFALLISAKDPETGEPLNIKELGGETATLVVAGTDTTSTALAAALFYLAHYPEAYKKLSAEVRTAFLSSDEIHLGSQLSQCAYLRACIDEAMRMSPSAPGCLWREAEAEGVKVDDKYIPKSMDVGTCIYSIHHNPEYYPDPFGYHPERWLVNDPLSTPYRGSVVPSAPFTPFSLGSRSCIGKGLAYVELTLTLAHLFWKYDFQLVEDNRRHVGEGKPHAEFGRHRVDEFQMHDHVTATKDGPWLRFKSRF
ncbi:cytochrome P450 [Talaromyces proteolyticus]|uniref:Cytochrome P450 n=1 Tax=Talaromyces proteolyticus TaxID=1131652 RepID=A0AAD4KL57_9EURO|nr:cytochrome P450 [Talaromyces proteolyticus]KAH8693928.1 cytochrome P450 [Talaromyces proteolyticus]